MSAIEFSVFMTIVIIMYIGIVKFSHALTVDRRVSSVASAVADLTHGLIKSTQAKRWAFFSAASSIMTPYSVTPISIVLTSVVADADNATTGQWSSAHNGSAGSTGSTFTLPEGLTQPFSSFVVAVVSFNYTPPLGKIFTAV